MIRGSEHRRVDAVEPFEPETRLAPERQRQRSVDGRDRPEVRVAEFLAEPFEFVGQPVHVGQPSVVDRHVGKDLQRGRPDARIPASGRPRTEFVRHGEIAAVGRRPGDGQTGAVHHVVVGAWTGDEQLPRPLRRLVPERRVHGQMECGVQVRRELRVVSTGPAMGCPNLSDDALETATTERFVRRSDVPVDLTGHAGEVLRVASAHQVGRTGLVEPLRSDGTDRREHAVARGGSIDVDGQQRPLRQRHEVEDVDAAVSRQHRDGIGCRHRAGEHREPGQGVP